MQAQVRQKQKQLEALVGELNMEQARGEDHKDAIARLQQEVVEIKRMWLAAKRREQKRKQKASQSQPVAVQKPDEAALFSLQVEPLQL
jgi:hypothetical protein